MELRSREQIALDPCLIYVSSDEGMAAGSGTSLANKWHPTHSPRANYNIHTLRRRSASRRMLCEFGKLKSCIKIKISLIIHPFEPFEHWGMVFFSVECVFKVYHIVEQSVRDFAFWCGVYSFMAGNEISMIRQDKT